MNNFNNWENAQHLEKNMQESVEKFHHFATKL